MNTRFFVFLFALLQFTVVQAREKMQTFERAAFYNTIESGTVDQVDSQLDVVKGLSDPEGDAFEGALLMKKAGLVAAKKEKLRLFKSGRSKLESSITKARTNIEFRFLRLIIQENAPKAVKYSSDIKEDSDLIRKFYRNQVPGVQAAINHYVKKSKVLKPSDL